MIKLVELVSVHWVELVSAISEKHLQNIMEDFDEYKHLLQALKKYKERIFCSLSGIDMWLSVYIYILVYEYNYCLLNVYYKNSSSIHSIDSNYIHILVHIYILIILLYWLWYLLLIFAVEKL